MSVRLGRPGGAGGPGEGSPARSLGAVQRRCGWRLVLCVLMLLVANTVTSSMPDNASNVMQFDEAGMPDSSLNDTVRGLEVNGPPDCDVFGELGRFPESAGSADDLLSFPVSQVETIYVFVCGYVDIRMWM